MVIDVVFIDGQVFHCNCGSPRLIKLGKSSFYRCIHCLAIYRNEKALEPYEVEYCPLANFQGCGLTDNIAEDCSYRAYDKLSMRHTCNYKT